MDDMKGKRTATTPLEKNIQIPIVTLFEPVKEPTFHSVQQLKDEIERLNMETFRHNIRMIAIHDYTGVSWR